MGDGFKTHDPARQAKSPWYHDGYIRGVADARLLAQEQQPRGMSPQQQHSFMYREGYKNGLNTAVTLVQRASSATRPPADAPWRAPRGDNERAGRRPGPWQVANVGPHRHELAP